MYVTSDDHPSSVEAAATEKRMVCGEVGGWCRLPAAAPKPKREGELGLLALLFSWPTSSGRRFDEHDVCEE